MILRRIILQDFRNVVFADLSFDGEAQFFVGANGQGKTNLLEAIGFVTALRSFRTNEQRLLIREGCNEAALAYDFFLENEGDCRVTIRLRHGRKEVTVDQRKMERMAEFIGRFPVVVFSSDDIHIVRGSAGMRRRLIDVTVAAADSAYYEALRDYHKALAARNRFLKSDSPEAAASFEVPMARSAAILIEKRREAVTQFATLAASLYGALTGGAEDASFSYEPDLDSASSAEFRQSWADGRSRDLAAGLTRKGPHRDDYRITFSGKAAREFGSEGQQRGLALALRMAQLRYLHETLGVRPVLLADDIVNELDPERRRRFWESLDRDTQVLAAGTVLPETSPRDKWQIFSVNSGRFEESPE